MNPMKQALEALEWATERIDPESATDCNCPLCKAIDALNAALAAPHESATEAAVKAEREACARVAESFDPEKRWSNHGQVIAKWIRERGGE